MGDNKFVIDYGDGPLKQAQEQLGLVDLINRVKSAPTEQALKEQELVLKNNEVTQIETKNALQFQQLKSAVYDEERKKSEFTNNTLLNIRKGFEQDFQMGFNMLNRAIPGATAFKKENGAVAIDIPGSDLIVINPNRSTDPKEIESMTQDRVQTWDKISAAYRDVYKNSQSVKSQLSLVSGPGDISAIYARAKMQDPGGRVTDGDYRSVMQSPNVTEQVKNWLTRATKQEGPIFGDAKSQSRKDFLKSAETQISDEKNVFLPSAKFFLEGQILRDGLDPQKIYSPVGDITLESLGYDKIKNSMIPASESVDSSEVLKKQSSQAKSSVAPTVDSNRQSAPPLKLKLKFKTDLWLKKKFSTRPGQ